MIDVFIRTNPVSPIRRYLANAVAERWDLFNDVNVGIMRGVGNDFHWRCRAKAEEISTGDYIFSDDDIMPIDEKFVESMREDWAKVPKDVTMLGGISAIWTERSHIVNGPLIKVPTVGGIAMIRKGVIPFNQFSGDCARQDGIISDWINANGYCSMISTRLLWNHLGFGLSESTPGCWLRA